MATWFKYYKAAKQPQQRDVFVIIDRDSEIYALLIEEITKQKSVNTTRDAWHNRLTRITYLDDVFYILRMYISNSERNTWIIRRALI